MFGNTCSHHFDKMRVTQSHFRKRTNPARAYSDRACLFLNGAFESTPYKQAFKLYCIQPPVYFPMQKAAEFICCPEMTVSEIAVSNL